MASASMRVVSYAGSGASSVSIATRRPSRAASAHAHSTWASWSAAVASIHGMPPTTSAPSAIACSTSSAAPGSRSTPSCGNATTVTSTRPRNSSRAASTACTPTSPAAVSTSAKACTCRTPLRSPSASACRMGGRSGLEAVVLLDRAGEVDAAGGTGHAGGRVRLQSGVADQRQGAHLVQVQVRVDERLGDQPARRVDALGTRRRRLFARRRQGGDRRRRRRTGRRRPHSAGAPRSRRDRSPAKC